ncbi:uncharacterized protein [Macrobrachium rosenbergii]|uniref:uncharacterized protein n=1 Tax=Macrobrachium rosenbergii TaxID=79674 RepID=UPI0034D7B1AA
MYSYATRGWASNNKQFDSEVHVEEQAEIPILGMVWNCKSDTLLLKPFMGKGVINQKWVPTKRKILFLVVSNFDPLGLVYPVFVKSENFLQVLWNEKVGWDDVLTPERATEAREILADFMEIGQLKFKRGVVSENSELHDFCDASMKAYGGIAYARNVNGETNLLTTKLRITLIRNMLTIPRLELMVLLRARLAKYLSYIFKFSKVTIWGDSKVAIAWVGSKIENKNTFIANRA